MKKWAGVIGLSLIALLAWGYWAGWGEPSVTQPIEFPHKVHVQQLKLNCTNCHQRAERDAAAGRPPTALCFACHAAVEAKNDEMKKVRAFGESGKEIPWRRVWRLPAHVFFPHRTHVVVARVKCQTCHGPMETLDRPPARPLRKLAMDDCIGCHEKWEWPKEITEGGTEPVRVAAGRRVSTDCYACHR